MSIQDTPISYYGVSDTILIIYEIIGKTSRMKFIQLTGMGIAGDERPPLYGWESLSGFDPPAC
jgi:hypothetical protein